VLRQFASIPLLLSTIAVSVPLLGTTPAVGASTPQSVDLAQQVEVIRTDYGVPHIYAENFRALGYALGYLQLEDYGERVALGMIRARGELARHQGRQALEADFDNRWYYLRAVDRYEELGADTRDVYEGFAAGVGRYVEMHPEEFPSWMVADFTGYDVAALYMYRVTDRVMRRWERRLSGSAEGQDLDRAAFAAVPERDAPADPIEEGSSAWALAPERTTSNAAILMRNPHLSWDAGYWEVHVVVPGRLDFYGDFRIGGPLGIIGGFNRYLGFATTNNDIDNVEVYALEIDPNREDHYLLDGQSIPVIREPVTVEYVDGQDLASETRDRVYTELGPIVHQTEDLIYVLRSAEDGEFRAGEQFLRLIEARDFDQWKDAMRMRAHPGSNFTYADVEGNIFYIWYGAIPDRPHPAGDGEAVPVSGMAEIWTQLHSLDALPQILNPIGGYLRDENEGPWRANLNEPLDPSLYPDYFQNDEFGLRSQHSAELIGNRDQLSLEDVVRLKHSYRMLLADRVKDDLTQALRQALGRGDIENSVVAALLLIERWDNRVAPESRGALLFEEWWRIYSNAFDDADADADAENDAEDGFALPWTAETSIETPRGLADPDLAVRSFPVAIRRTIERYGALGLPWGEVHRVRRGEVDEPVGGCSGALGCFRVLNFDDDSDGRQRVVGGDGWVLAVEFTDPPRAYSVLGYGQSAKEESIHYADQAAMFARGEMKPVAYTDEDVDRSAIRRYRPGVED